MTLLKRLRALVDLTGPSGHEEDVIRFLAHQVAELGDEVAVDPLGNLIVTRQGTRPGARRLLLCAHADEIGFITRSIDANGFLRFEKIGGHDDRLLLARRVWVRGSNGRLLGVINGKSVHLTPAAERERVVKHSEMFIDLGATSADQVREMGISVGDPIGLVGELAEVGVGTGRVIGKSLDNRASCALLWQLLADLRGIELPGDLYVVFSVQEEVGLRGARTAAQALEADVALAVDMTAGDDTPDTGAGHLRLGAGPAIKLMDFSFIAHPAVRRALADAAQRANVPTQIEILTGIGTDAGALHQAGRGVPTGCLSVVNRYTHSSIEMLDLKDLDGASKLLRAFVDGIQDYSLSFL